MKRKGKAKRRKQVRARHAADTYTTTDIMERHNCSQRTIRRRTKFEGFAKPTRAGKEYIYLKASVHAWEKIHMPHLWPAEPPVDDQEHWDDMTAVLKGEQAAERIEARNKKPPPKKPKKRKR